MNTHAATRERSLPSTAEQRLKELEIKLSAPPDAFGTHVEAVQTSNLLFLSGMLPTEQPETQKTRPTAARVAAAAIAFHRTPGGGFGVGTGPSPSQSLLFMKRSDPPAETDESPFLGA